MSVDERLALGVLAAFMKPSQIGNANAPGCTLTYPTQKPLEIFERPISYHTQLGDLVYEPFSGSGSQLIAAAKLGRRCYAMELEPAFVDVARIRWTSWAKSADVDPGPGALE